VGRGLCEASDSAGRLCRAALRLRRGSRRCCGRLPAARPAKPCSQWSHQHMSRVRNFGKCVFLKPLRVDTVKRFGLDADLVP